MLVFLTGQEEIEIAVVKSRELCRQLIERSPDCARLVPIGLYAAMTVQQQQRVFTPTKPVGLFF